MSKLDPARMGAWFDQHASCMVLYARQWLEPDSAEDVVQEVFIKMASLGYIPDQPKSWLFAAVRNKALTMLRSKSRRRRHERLRAAAAPRWFAPQADVRIDAATAEAALRELPLEQREVIVLRIWAGMPFREIAAITSASISTLHSRYQAGLTAVRQKLEASCRTRNS